MLHRDIIVIGASAGGVNALCKLLELIPTKLAASIFIVMHLDPHHKSYLVEVLAKCSQLPVFSAENKGRIKKGQVYLAKQNQHLILSSKITLCITPKVNNFRPSIDVLFNSAAIHYQQRTIGILLTGLPGDGMLGLQNIHLQGGLTIVQDPSEAQFPDLPKSALNIQGVVDYCLPIKDIAALLAEFTKEKIKKIKKKIPNEKLAIEYEGFEGKVTTNENLMKIGPNYNIACPACHGALWNINDEIGERFRCRIGHDFSLESLMQTHNDSLENILWSAVRSLEESAALSFKIAKEMKNHKNKQGAALYFQKGDAVYKQAAALRHLLLELNANSKKM